MEDIKLIDKPKGITSFDVIRRLRRKYSEEHGGEKAPKMGHAGTLDPLATGLMIVGIGSGTKKLKDLIKLDKEYEAEVLIGQSRTTGDMEGEVVDEKVVEEGVEILQSKISTALEEMKGELELPVSAYSAIKVNGIPMYKRARQAEQEGEVVTDVPIRKMEVKNAELLSVEKIGNEVIVKIKFAVGSGTYIRSLAEEIGRRIGYPASLQNLRRTRVGDFKINDAIKMSDE